MQHYLEYGGDGPVVQVAPANGFPPEAYHPLADELTTGYRVVGYRPRPLWPSSQPSAISRWHDLARDMAHDMAQFEQPIIGVGHSLGGIISLYNALWTPERFRALVLLDPVLLPQRTLASVWLTRYAKQQHRLPLVQGAMRRRDHFASNEEAAGHYRKRRLFADFAPAALDGYITGGFRPDGDGGVTLAWSRAWESRIFSLVAVDTWDAIRQLPPSVPLLFVRGRRSDLLVDRSWQQLQRLLPHAQLAEFAGGHMFPLEQPQAVASTIRQFLRTVADVPPA